VFGDEELTISQVQPDLMPLFSGVIPELNTDDAPCAVAQHSSPKARRGLQPLLSGKDFILPVAVDRAENGDLRVAATGLNDAVLQQVFALAEVEERPPREFSSLEFAEQQLERRRYRDWLKREPKNGLSRRDELQAWRNGGSQAEENFRLWWQGKEEKRRSALFRKAGKLANCRRCGRPMDCSVNESHSFYVEFACELRYCVGCGAQIFTTYFSKYTGLWPIVEKLVVSPGFRSESVIATLDFTARNSYRMPTPLEIREFNHDVRLCVKKVVAELGIAGDQFLFLWCDEFGGWRADKKNPTALSHWQERDIDTEAYNTNMHGHGVWVGPRIPYQMLLRTWIDIRSKKDGARGVYIKRPKLSNPPNDKREREHCRFTRALGHALKYTGKHHARSDAKRLAELEIAFHGVRRIHTMGLAYKADLRCPEKCSLCDGRCDCWSGHNGQHSCKSHRPGSSCPLCGAYLMYPRDCGYRFISDLKREGRRSLAEVKREVARTRVFAGPRGPGP
jgi:hypothetical protein